MGRGARDEGIQSSAPGTRHSALKKASAGFPDSLIPGEMQVVRFMPAEAEAKIVESVKSLELVKSVELVIRLCYPVLLGQEGN